MNKINHIFFDLDRTLWDFETNSKVALTQIFEELNLKDHIPAFEDFYTKYREVNAEFWKDYTSGTVTKEELRGGRFLKTLNAFNVNDSSLGNIIGDKYMELSPYQTNLFPGTKDTLENLKNDNYQLHIITNGFKEVQFIKLENSGIKDYFTDILCSEEVGVSKPDSKVFYSALERTKAINHESMMIGDDFNADVLGAERCGIRALLFDPHNHFIRREQVEIIQSLTEIPSKLVGL